MKNNLEKYDKLVTVGLIVVAFVLGIGWWFAEEKSEPFYLSKIDKLMFDKDNKAPKFVLTLPEKLTTQTKDKNDEILVDALVEQEKEKENEKPFDVDNLLASVPILQNIPNKPATQQLENVDHEESLLEVTKEGLKIPRISEKGKKPWIEYGKVVQVQPNFKKIAIVLSGLGFDTTSAEKMSTIFDSEISMSFSPYVTKPYEALLKARSFGHETYMDLLLPSKNYLKEDTGPMSINMNLSIDEALKRFYKIIDKPIPVGGLVIRDGVASDANSIILTTLLNETKKRGLLIIDATLGDKIDKLKINGLPRRRADLVITKDMNKDDINILLKQAENIAFDKGQVLIVTDPKPFALIELYNWVKTFSPQISYEEAKTIDISKPFALVPVSNLVVE